ncbi:hypothetical protein SNE40_013800 [Patella caerulea]|uniref:Reelin domain-containing protein n=1 Tax=Patella caerulea TaxID=87958 RepID=A0AAN8JD84_PATCE
MIILLVVMFLAGCESYMTGAPNGICSVQRQRPYHDSFLPQMSPAPYRIETNSTSYRPNEPINITITGDGVSFKGFFVTADTTSGAFNGRVDNVTSNVRMVRNCGMTHTDNSSKTSVTIVWTPPPLVHVGNVRFISVVVANFSTFWNNVGSALLTPDFTVYETHKSVWAKMYAQAQNGQQQGGRQIGQVQNGQQQGSRLNGQVQNGQQQGGRLNGQVQNGQQQRRGQRGQGRTNRMRNVNGMQSQFRSMNG